MIQLIASDMDGTLLNEKMTVSSENAAAIQRAAQLGIKFIVATGRGYTEAKPLIEQVGIEAPIITMNGAQVFNDTGEVIDTVSIRKEVVRKIFHVLKEKGLYFEAMTTKGTFSDSKMKRIQNVASLLVDLKTTDSFKIAVSLASARLELMDINYVASYDTVLDDKDNFVLKVIAFSPEKREILAPIADQLEQLGNLAITASSASNIEINHINAQKGIALETYANSLGINMNNVMSIGDNLNDRSMLEAAGVSFAMGNATEKIKQVARYLTDTNVKDGVGKAINRAIDEKL
ncbi:HAD family hydrolase [Loigolactobacillus backii]|uniref:Cof-type HAD-IIB family hydrolase n=1 Tax=Loigolactobacillus backii TaxID=375175 RepID=UPI000C1C9AC1|nr:Cof-type HAD-IIB family hydrolase [Loigolactobacillus backii]PIO83860.1 HAD family hydrolase [Loigolactobacillus backii]